jgi:arabinoxylan arabinofuranohydrolase
MALTANGTTTYLQLTPTATVNASGWTQLSGTATVSWSGTLTRAILYVETAAGTDNFSIDDVSFQ